MVILLWIYFCLGTTCRGDQGPHGVPRIESWFITCKAINSSLTGKKIAAEPHFVAREPVAAWVLGGKRNPQN